MATKVTADRVVLFVQPGGFGSAISPMSIDGHGFTGKTDNTIPGIGQVFGRDAFGRPRVKITFPEPPSGLNTGSIDFERTMAEDFMEARVRRLDYFGVWEFSIPCGLLNDPTAWLRGGRLDYRGRMRVTGYSEGDAPVREFNGQPVTVTIPVSWEYNITFYPLSLTDQTTSETQNLNGIDGLSDPAECVPGYAGPNKHFYVVANASAGVTANVIYTKNGGSTWAATSADPFAADENISDVLVFLTGNYMRVLVSRGTTDASNPAEVAYADVSFGDEGTTSWTNVNVGSTNGDVIHRLYRAGYSRVYASVSGDIFYSANQGVTWTSLMSGSTQINAIVKGYGQDCNDVWFGGASNLLLREVNFSGVIETMTGPSGGGTFYSLAFSNSGILYAGNGSSIYKSINNGLNTGGWSSLKDFGTNKVVRNIFLPEGDSEHIYVTVDDTSGSSGALWFSNDGGNTFNRVDLNTNAGYNDAYPFLDDPNRFLIVGDAVSSVAQIHLASPSETGC